MGLRRKKQQEPARRPHPEGRVEVQLQRILALQELAARKQRGLDDTYEEIRRLRGQARTAYYNSDKRQLNKMADELQEKVPAMEAGIPDLHEQIAKLAAELTSDELLWL